jgi:hypothetical protein
MRHTPWVPILFTRYAKNIMAKTLAISAPTWCRHNSEERTDGIDFARLCNLAFAVL